MTDRVAVEATAWGGSGPAETPTAYADSLDGLIQRMVDEGHFVGAVLATADGLPIASASSREDAEVTSAMVAMLSRVSEEAKRQLGMAEVDEVTIRDRERSRLVCRSLSVAGEELLLAVRVPARRSHRRATNQAIRRIQRAWLDWQP